MKRYWVIATIVAIGLAVLIFVGVGIYTGVAVGSSKSQAKKFTQDTVALRYYMSDDYDNAEIVYMRITNKSNYSLTKLPFKAGYEFVGLYDGTDYATATVYVDRTGKGIKPLTGDILLYPIFVENMA